MIIVQEITTEYLTDGTKTRCDVHRYDDVQKAGVGLLSRVYWLEEDGFKGMELLDMLSWRKVVNEDTVLMDGTSVLVVWVEVNFVIFEE